jgi:hypothetical protein
VKQAILLTETGYIADQYSLFWKVKRAILLGNMGNIDLLSQ